MRRHTQLAEIGDQVVDRRRAAALAGKQQDDQDEWARRWFRFAERCACVGKPPNDDKPAMLDWKDRPCAGFATSFRLLDRMQAPEDQST